MIKRLFSFCESNQLISPNDIVFIAVSGGIDSMALLHSFLELTAWLPLQIKAVHINHGVRGAEADRDERFVRFYCQKENVELIVKKLHGFDRDSSEDALRQARYQAFEAILKEFPKAKMATAHTLNDNIETFLMRLAKGSSLKGLTGIPIKRGPFIRPFLFLRRSEIESYIAEKNIPFVQDSTNAELRYLRNRIRHYLLPAFEKVFGEDFFRGMARSFDELKAHYDLFEKEFKRFLPQALQRHEDKIRIDVKKFRKLDALYRFRLIAYCIYDYYPLNYLFSKTYVKRIDDFIARAKTGARLNIHENLVLIKDRSYVIFWMEHPHERPVSFLGLNVTLRFGKYELQIKKVQRKEVRFSKDKNVEFICGKNIHFPLFVRQWQSGDRFYPLGLGKSQKVKKFFINQKIDLSEKKEIPIVCNGNEIVWIASLRLDERYRVKDNCEDVYCLISKKIGP